MKLNIGHINILLSLPKPQSGKMTQVPMFTSKGCDIGRGDATIFYDFIAHLDSP